MSVYFQIYYSLDALHYAIFSQPFMNLSCSLFLQFAVIALFHREFKPDTKCISVASNVLIVFNQA